MTVVGVTVDGKGPGLDCGCKRGASVWCLRGTVVGVTVDEKGSGLDCGCT